MSNPIIVDKIGIEFEFDCENRSVYYSNYGISAGDTHNGYETDGEYYDNQVEYKTPMMNPTKENILAFRNAMKKNISDWTDSYPTSASPAFVGTHIHMFFKSNRTGNTITQIQRGDYKEWFVLNSYVQIAKFFLKYANEIAKVGEEEYSHKCDYSTSSSRKMWNHFYREVVRVTASNNLLKYYDTHALNNALLRNLQSLGCSYTYKDIGSNRPKYQPVIWSLARPDGKPLSLEYRLIPNSLFLLSSDEEITSFVTDLINATENFFGKKGTEKTKANNVARILIPKIHAAIVQLVSGTSELIKFKKTDWFTSTTFPLREALDVIRKNESVLGISIDRTFESNVSCKSEETNLKTLLEKAASSRNVRDFSTQELQQLSFWGRKHAGRMPVPPSEISLQMSLHGITPLQALLCSVNRTPIKQDLEYRRKHNIIIMEPDTLASPAEPHAYYGPGISISGVRSRFATRINGERVDYTINTSSPTTSPLVEENEKEEEPEITFTYTL